MDAIEAAYISAKDRMPGVSFCEFKKSVSDFDVHPIIVLGDIVGGLFVLGPVIHACVIPSAKKRWFSKRLAGVLNDIIDKYGYAETIPTTEEGLKFILSLGFEKIGNVYRSNKKWASNRY